jgi:hypothetical protein
MAFQALIPVPCSVDGDLSGTGARDGGDDGGDRQALDDRARTVRGAASAAARRGGSAPWRLLSEKSLTVQP